MKKKLLSFTIFLMGLTTIMQAQPCSVTIDYAVTNGQNSQAVFSAVPGYPTISGKNITITGTMNVDQFIQFNNCNIIMAANAKINLTTGNLTIASATHIFSCTSMWDGIYVPTGRTLNLNSNAFIEDALNAVVSTGGGVFTIDNTIFNRNLIAVDVRAAAGAHAGTIKGSIITSRSIPSYANTSSNYSAGIVKATATSFTAVVLKSPYTDRKGLFGINATDVGSIQIGSTAVASDINYFDAIMCGVNLLRTDANVYNNRFQYLLGYNGVSCGIGVPCYYDNGTGVRALGTSNTGTNNLVVGAAGTGFRRNTFFNTYCGVYVESYKNTDVSLNTLTCSTTGPFVINNNINYGAQGISIVNPTLDNTVYVTTDSVLNYNSAVYVDRNSANSLTMDLYIRNNTITGAAPGYCTTAIYVNDYIGGTYSNTTGSWGIYNNKITDVANGISLSNIKTPSSQMNYGLSVLYNSIRLRYASTGTLIGIKVKDCQNLRLERNHVKADVSTASLTSGNIGLQGIHLINSNTMLVRCNQVEQVGQGLIFEGACSSSYNTASNPYQGVITNIMGATQDGFVLTASGVIGLQGNLTSFASDNDFTGPFSHAATNCINSSAASSKLFFYSKAIPTLNLASGTGVAYSTASGSLKLSTASSTPICDQIAARVTTSVTEQKETDETSFNLYPNPNDGHMTFTYSLAAQSSGAFILYDITGRIVNQYKLTTGQNNSLSISEEQLNNGVYFYAVSIDNILKETKKIVIAK